MAPVTEGSEERTRPKLPHNNKCFTIVFPKHINIHIDSPILVPCRRPASPSWHLCPSPSRKTTTPRSRFGSRKTLTHTTAPAPAKPRTEIQTLHTRKNQQQLEPEDPLSSSERAPGQPVSLRCTCDPHQHQHQRTKPSGKRTSTSKILANDEDEDDDDVTRRKDP